MCKSPWQTTRLSWNRWSVSASALVQGGRVVGDRQWWSAAAATVCIGCFAGECIYRRCLYPELHLDLYRRLRRDCNRVWTPDWTVASMTTGQHLPAAARETLILRCSHSARCYMAPPIHCDRGDRFDSGGRPVKTLLLHDIRNGIASDAITIDLPFEYAAWSLRVLSRSRPRSTEWREAVFGTRSPPVPGAMSLLKLRRSRPMRTGRGTRWYLLGITALLVASQAEASRTILVRTLPITSSQVVPPRRIGGGGQRERTHRPGCAYAFDRDHAQCLEPGQRPPPRAGSPRRQRGHQVHAAPGIARVSGPSTSRPPIPKTLSTDASRSTSAPPVSRTERSAARSTRWSRRSSQTTTALSCPPTSR